MSKEQSIISELRGRSFAILAICSIAVVIKILHLQRVRNVKSYKLFWPPHKKVKIEKNATWKRSGTAPVNANMAWELNGDKNERLHERNDKSQWMCG